MNISKAATDDNEIAASITNIAIASVRSANARDVGFESAASANAEEVKVLAGAVVAGKVLTTTLNFPVVTVLLIKSTGFLNVGSVGRLRKTNTESSGADATRLVTEEPAAAQGLSSTTASCGKVNLGCAFAG